MKHYFIYSLNKYKTLNKILHCMESRAIIKKHIYVIMMFNNVFLRYKRVNLNRFQNLCMYPATCIFPLSLFFISSCTKFLQVDPPKTEISTPVVFTTDALAKGAISGMYAQLINSPSFASGSISSITYLCGLTSDDLIAAAPNNGFENNTLLSTNATVGVLWAELYKSTYTANSILESLGKSEGVSYALKKQLEGEAKFIRAFTHFYLVNLFGDIPLMLTTDYRINASLPRELKSKVYEQIISDLLDAQKLLPNDYSFSNNERNKPNKWAATALLARTYLFIGDWQNSEIEASKIINNKSNYDTVSLANVFLKNSKEAIWQLSRDDGNTYDAATFFIPATATAPNNASIRPILVKNFEKGDRRKNNWIDSLVRPTITYYYTKKYKINTLSPISEYSMVLRLAEQYLIRAEARINQPSKISEGIADLNILRRRASLPAPDNLLPLSLLLSKEDAMIALENERRYELFTEWGHRWLDLKRWSSRLSPGDNTLSRADDVLQPIKVGWKKEWKLYPIPQIQILNDPAMANAQNPGYN